ncbi:dolichyl-diphosphooligosaccharide--protein glycosyltransferase subunit 1 [Tieghemiomyces parasiticus]|uniref:Dolichyl-diphosphooligosaccharide--protein glycosyltransferase subunit 1 n=1 Tax=Tieghemiomyces parasiticus TaxID=78921 RepID=A0A9W7ZRZ3_9FUNG|nr:dolichyl-diphosphooligosaccharide--protein glycosyltransferase subunit 1 [Tieghemiomyces parasiticus]
MQLLRTLQGGRHLFLAALVLVGISQAAVVMARAVNSAVSEASGDLTQVVVTRKVDLSRTLVREKVDTELRNTGQAPVQHYYWLMPNATAAQVGLVYANDVATGEALLVTPLPDVVRDDATAETYAVFDIELLHPLAPGQSTKLNVLVAHTAALSPLPRALPQFGQQYLVYSGDAYLPSLYPSKRQTTKITLPSGKTESFSDQPTPVAKSGRTITYGPYRDLPAFARAPLRVHYPCDLIPLVIPTAERHVEISHWAGHASVDEHAVVKHNGAVLKGHFQQVLQLIPNTPVGIVINNFALELPVTAHSVYFKDEVGNVSTTHLRYDRPRAAVLEFMSRYQLAGGWIYNWNHGYKQPLTDLLRYDPSTERYNLRVTLPSYFPDAPVEDAYLEVVLPEGAQDVAIRTAATLDDVTEGTFYSYMDSVGRPTVRIHRRLVVPELDQFPIIVSYRFNPLYLLLKPFVLAGALLAFFGLASAVSRMNFQLLPHHGSHATSVPVKDTNEPAVSSTPGLSKKVAAAPSTPVPTRKAGVPESGKKKRRGKN